MMKVRKLCEGKEWTIWPMHYGCLFIYLHNASYSIVYVLLLRMIEHPGYWLI